MDVSFAATRVTGGHYVTESPSWMGRVHKNGYTFCSATLISPRWALTAAHCHLGWSNPQEAKITFGSAYKNGWRGQTSSVKRAIPHPSGETIFAAGMSTINLTVVNGYDFLLLELETPISLAPVKLATPEMNPEILSLSNLLSPYILGWGTIDANASVGTNILKTSGAMIMSNPANCWQASNLDRHYCFQSPVANACKGDSGGPALLSWKGQTYQIGVASFITPKILGQALCQNGNTISVYSNVGTVLGWIESVVGTSLR